MTTRLFESLPGDAYRQDTVRYLDAIGLLLSSAQIHYFALRRSAMRTTRKVAAEGKAPPPDRVVAHVVAFVTAVNRLRTVLKRLPGDPETRTARKVFESDIQQIETVRNHLEHLDTNLPNLESPNQGPFGAISWWYTYENQRGVAFVVPGHLEVGRQAVTRVPKSFRASVDHIHIDMGDENINLSEVYYAVVALRRRLAKWDRRQAVAGWPALRSSGG